MGVAYRYYDLRMNVVPLFSDRKEASGIWHDTIHWWLDSTIKIRFVEIDDEYWIIIGSDSQHPESNMSFFKVLQKSENYERFKKGHGGEAYLRLGIYTKKSREDVKNDALCDCGHAAEDHAVRFAFYGWLLRIPIPGRRRALLGSLNLVRDWAADDRE